MKVDFSIRDCIFIMKNKCAQKLVLITAITIAVSWVAFTKAAFAQMSSPAGARTTQQDFSRLSCSQLEYLATKYERIAESAARLAETATSGVVSTGSSIQAQQAYQMALNLRMIMLRKSCPPQS